MHQPTVLTTCSLSSGQRACHNSHKLAEPTTINWPRMVTFTEVLPRNCLLSEHKMGASSALQA